MVRPQVHGSIRERATEQLVPSDTERQEDRVGDRGEPAGNGTVATGQQHAAIPKRHQCIARPGTGERAEPLPGATIEEQAAGAGCPIRAMAADQQGATAGETHQMGTAMIGTGEGPYLPAIGPCVVDQ